MFQIAMKCPPIKPSGHCSWHIGNLTWQSNFLFLSQNFVTLNGPSTHYINDNVGWGFILQELDWDNFTSGHSVLLSSVAVEKLGGGQDQCSDHGPQSGNHLVRGYQHEDNQIIFFFRESEKRQKKKMLVDYLVINLKNHNFWTFKYFFCEFLCLLNITGNKWREKESWGP